MQNKILDLLKRPVSQKWCGWILVGCVLASLLIRFLVNRAEPTIDRDGVIYVDLATRWIQTGSYPFHSYLPLYPWMMKQLMLCGMSGYAAGVTVNIILGSLIPLVAYGILRVINGRREIALVTAILTVFHPMLVELASTIVRDTSYLFFTGTAVFFALYAVKSEKWYAWSACNLLPV